jgi:hypothetical protein
MTGIASTLDSARDTAAPTPVAKIQGAMRTLTLVADRKIELLETDTEVTLADFERGLARLKSRQVSEKSSSRSDERIAL